jgi:mono/diheme cytochrome c family protein
MLGSIERNQSWAGRNTPPRPWGTCFIRQGGPQRGRLLASGERELAATTTAALRTQDYTRSGVDLQYDGKNFTANAVWFRAKEDLATTLGSQENDAWYLQVFYVTPTMIPVVPVLRAESVQSSNGQASTQSVNAAVMAYVRSNINVSFDYIKQTKVPPGASKTHRYSVLAIFAFSPDSRCGPRRTSASAGWRSGAGTRGAPPPGERRQEASMEQAEDGRGGAEAAAGGGRRAPLGAPGDPAIGFPAARLEWYFLSLFQLMKLFPGPLEVVGGVVIPGAVIGVLAALPWIGRRERGHRFAVGFVLVLIAGAGVLTLLALRADSTDPDYQAALAEAEASARRAVELAAAAGIPADGAASLLRRDPLTNGPRLFARHCAKCHRFGGHDGLGRRTEQARAADLQGFASFEWLLGLLDKDRIDGDGYYGGTKFEGGAMSEYLNDECPLTPDQLRLTAAALSAEAGLPAQRESEAGRRYEIAAGLAYLKDEEVGCARCHRFHDAGTANLDRSPDLTGYGTREWLVGMIGNPWHSSFYGSENDDMPAFGAEKILTREEIVVVADWLRGDWAPTRETPPTTGPDRLSASQP